MPTGDWVVRQMSDASVKQFREQDFENHDPHFMRGAIAPLMKPEGCSL
jgi:hypothetical protein